MDIEPGSYEIIYGEEHPNYQRLLVKYTHVGCPHMRFEDNCAHPSDCALAGGCLDLRKDGKP